MDHLFSPREPLEFIDHPITDDICPESFIGWLQEEGELEYGDDTPYRRQVTGHCEYSCLYLGMLTSYPFKVYFGSFAGHEHWWLGMDDIFIDLTLAQFGDYPELSITKRGEPKQMGYHWYSEPEPIEDYLQRVQAREFYIDPVTGELPPKRKELDAWQLKDTHRIMEGPNDWL